MHVALADQQQQSLNCCFIMLMNSFKIHITTQKLAFELSASKEYVNNIMDALGYSKMGYHWVPGSLTNNHCANGVGSHLLSHYEADGESFNSRS